MTKRQEKLDEIDKVGVSRRKADQITGMFEELFDLRATALSRDLVGMEEVKTRLKRKGEELEDVKKAADAKKKRAQLEQRRAIYKRRSSRNSISNMSRRSS